MLNYQRVCPVSHVNLRIAEKWPCHLNIPRGFTVFKHRRDAWTLHRGAGATVPNAPGAAPTPNQLVQKCWRLGHWIWNQGDTLLSSEHLKKKDLVRMTRNVTIMVPCLFLCSSKCSRFISPIQPYFSWEIMGKWDEMRRCALSAVPATTSLQLVVPLEPSVRCARGRWPPAKLLSHRIATMVLQNRECA